VKGTFFTGSTATGQQIAVKAALKPQLLELGGDGPFIILPDADVDARSRARRTDASTTAARRARRPNG
jgi:succinate-semialdehyde dehydrogenase/glutarate-semialdehyde dehydrogenase